MTILAPKGLVSERQIFVAALAELRKRLPTGWTVDAPSEGVQGRGRPDAVVVISAPDGQKATLYGDTKRGLVTKELSAIVDQLTRWIAAAPKESARGQITPLVIARYLAPPQQDWLAERKVAYVDATGNMRVALRKPALFLRDVGAGKDPWRGPGRPKGNLRGASAARIVRALVDFRPPYSVPGLMRLAGTPSGNTYRAIDFIEEQDLIIRSRDGKIADVRWRALLERWSIDYSFTKLVGVQAYLAPRGLPDLVKRLVDINEDGPIGRYAVTGSMATRKWDAYAPARNAMIYADKPEAIADYAGLRPADAGANVIITPAVHTAAFERTDRLDGAVIVAASQAAVDLLTAPGRGPEEGRALLDWMEKNEPAWRQ